MPKPNRQTVVSTDGTRIWAEAVGDQMKPAVVFLHGFASLCVVFEKRFADCLLVNNLYLVISNFPAWLYSCGTDNK